jgi:hypothetical protein
VAVAADQVRSKTAFCLDTDVGGGAGRKPPPEAGATVAVAADQVRSKTAFCLGVDRRVLDGSIKPGLMDLIDGCAAISLEAGP